MDEIGNHHDEYVAAPLDEKVRWMNSGKGAAATAQSAQALGAMAPAFAEHAQSMQNTMRRLGIAWSGQAANNAATSLQAAAGWAEQHGQATSSGQASVENYARSFTATVAQIVAPKPVPDLGFWDYAFKIPASKFFDIQTDHDAVLQENQRLNAEAVRALDQHEETTRLATLGFPDPSQQQGFTNPTTAGHLTVGPGSGGLPTGASNTPGPAGNIGAADGSHSDPGNAPSARPPITSPAQLPSTTAPSRPPVSVPTPTADPGPAGGLEPRGGPGTVWPVTPLPTGGGAPEPSPRSRPSTVSPRSGRPGGTPFVERGPTPGQLPTRPNPGATGAGPGAGWDGTEAGGRAGRVGVSPTAMPPPMTGSGLGGAGREHTHRNTQFIPSDEPFRVKFDDVAPPVIGVDDPDDGDEEIRP